MDIAVEWLPTGIPEDIFLETLYNSLTGQKTGKLIKHN